jgi:hypothetical protein
MKCISNDDAANTDEAELTQCFSIYSPWLDARTNSPANLMPAKLWLTKCLSDHGDSEREIGDLEVQMGRQRQVRHDNQE